MTAPSYHGWTHRPKALGGTDPIEIASGLPVAISLRGEASFATSSGALPFDSISWNDDSLFGYSGVSGATAKYVTVNQSGVYSLKFTAFWDSDFTAGDNPFLATKFYEPTADLEIPLPNVLGVDSWNDTQNIIYGEQLTTAEMDHHQLVANVVFGLHLENFTGETEVGFGVGVASGVARTKNFGAGISIVRLGDVTVEQTIA
jgi:hypothetical protein